MNALSGSVMRMRLRTRETVGGWSLADPTTAPPLFASGRRCHEPSCGAILSIYNEGNYCSLHHPILTLRMRGKKIKRAA
jgi:hypothetical protein